ncbi:PLP-dependent lyase/thiolase [Candidatus Gottesmanbacteria bacterium]|nr:PLP-dependent lyase/thiolase [Candidatus Gottesmanbacteria bacterium]
MIRQDLITLGEGNTPLVEVNGIYFKCEFKNPTGSHKDRAFALQVSNIKEKGIKKAVISSSGNAAISAANYCKLAGIALTVFVSPHINKKKLQILENLDCVVIKSNRPVSDSIKYAQKGEIYNLRQSTDINAVIGYESIASEIIDSKISPDAIFLPVSSGTTLIGIANGFKNSKYKIPVHAVQTDLVHPITGIFDKDFPKSDEKSMADAIVARYTPREAEVVNMIKQTGGWGWVITNEEMEKGRVWLYSHDLDCSYEGAATLAALWKATKYGYIYAHPVCILTGKFY